MKSLIISPHPDDELLGVGGTILKRNSKGNKVGWLIISDVKTIYGWDKKFVNIRSKEITKASKFFNFSNVYNLGFPSGRLDTIPIIDLVSKIFKVLKTFKPEEIFIPHNSDAHTDHKIVFDCVSSASKNFRAPFIKRILAYETLSETGFNLNKSDQFIPNHFEDISKQINKKIKAIDIYKSEFKKFPFPRSKEALISLAKFRGTMIGAAAAESFQLLNQIN